MFCYATWKVILYPKVFSPLRGLPEPTGGSLLMGHFKEIREKPTGIPMREWYAYVPLLTYLPTLCVANIL